MSERTGVFTGLPQAPIVADTVNDIAQPTTSEIIDKLRESGGHIFLTLIDELRQRVKSNAAMLDKLAHANGVMSNGVLTITRTGERVELAREFK